jgi:hypothetical protein
MASESRGDLAHSRRALVVEKERDDCFVQAGVIHDREVLGFHRMELDSVNGYQRG